MGIMVFLSGFFSCTKDLNRKPNNGITADSALSNYSGYQELFAKVYGSYGLTGSSYGGDDLQSITNGDYVDFLRDWFNLQENPTDESICAWNDPGITDIDYISWSASTLWTNALYYRLYYQIAICNEFIRQSADGTVASHGITGTNATEIKYMQAESRFIRAFDYWVLMDEYANPPFITEKDPVGSYIPPQISRSNLFNWVVGELKAIDPLLKAPKANDYGRADQAAAWALLSRMYLNANVYNGTSTTTYYDSAITYSSKVINAGYTLHSNFQALFAADNNKNNPEVILPIVYDGTTGPTWGGITFIIQSSFSDKDSSAAYLGITGGNDAWGGNRSRPNLPNLFVSGDGRAKFTGPRASTKNKIDAVQTFTDGLPVWKFTNKNADGTTPAPASIDPAFCYADFPLFRLGEQYLIYAEAVLRGGNGGSMAQAVSYINALRQRAYGNSNGNVTSLTLQQGATGSVCSIIDERAREMYWECQRRTDLVRFGLFTGSTYLWPWKGGSANGNGVSSIYNVYPIPASDLSVNLNLKQNAGY